MDLTNKEFNERVRQRSDIVDVVGEYVKLKKSGREYEGLCPFHEEKTPSFRVNPEKRLFHCFGCGAGGDVFGFIMKLKRLTFPEAIKFLADRAGMQRPEPPHLTKEEKERERSSRYIVLEGRLKERQIEILTKANKEHLNELQIQKLKSDAFMEFLPEIKELDELSLKAIKKQLKENFDIGPRVVDQEIKRQRQKTSTLLKEPLEGSKQVFNPRPYTKEILKSEHLKYDEYERFWIYDKKSGIWTNKAEYRLNSILRKRILGSDHYKRYCVAEIIDDLHGWTALDIGKAPVEPSPYLIPFNNGIYDLQNEKLIEYDPKYFFINKLLVNYNEEHKDCESADKLFSEIVDPTDMITLHEMIAYTLWREYPYPELFILYGSGRNGKGSFIKVLNRILGANNVCTNSVDDLQYNTFATSDLFGKLANVSGEMEYGILKHTGKLKMLTGEDLIRCEEKYKKAFPFRNYAKLFFLTNEVPVTRDRTLAFYSRIFFLEFPQEYPVGGEKTDSRVAEKIPQEEIEGLAYQSIETIKELMKKDFVFTNHKAFEGVAKKYEELSNPLGEFLKKNTEKEVDSEILVSEFNGRYLSYLKKNGFRARSLKEISQGMREAGYTKQSIKREGKVDWYWFGLKWK